MPRYDFRCDKCNKVVEKFIPAEHVGKLPNWNRINCEVCNLSMYITFSPDSAPGIIWKGGVAPVGRAGKESRIAQKQLEIYNEGFTSKSEVQESMEIAKEEEIKRGKTPGTLTTGVKAITTKADKEAVAKRSAKKIAESRSMRGQKRMI